MSQEKQDSKYLKILLLGIFCLAFSPIISAQTVFQKELNVGINGGVTISSVGFTSSRYSVRQDNLIQGVGGLSIRFISEKHFGIQGELNYSQRGWDGRIDMSNDDSDNLEFHYSRQLNYLELPVLTHIYFDMGRHFRAVFNLGPQIGFLMSEKTLETNMNKNDLPSDLNFHEQKVQRSFDWGLCFGGGVELRTGSGNFVLDGRYYYGLSDIFNNTRADVFASSSNQIISVKLTYFYKLGGN